MRFRLRVLALGIVFFPPGLGALQTESELSLLSHSLETRGNPTFTPEEDRQLIELKKQDPSLTWPIIAKSFPRHSTRSLRGRYEYYLKPNFVPDPHKSTPYTYEENQLLKELKEEGLVWEQIAESFNEHFPRRTTPALRKHYSTVLKTQPIPEVARPYTLQEDQCLEELKRQGRKWNEIVKYFPGRTAAALQLRWSDYLQVKLDLDLQQTKFTPEEDQRLRQLKEQGLKWAEIGKYFEGRSIAALQSRWRYYLEPKWEGRLKKADYTPEEDQLLIRLKGQGLKWAEIVEHFEGRSAGGLQRRWRDHLRPKPEGNPTKAIAYTPEEDQLLIRLKGQGLMWAEIAENFERRNVESLKNRWKVHLKPKVDRETEEKTQKKD